jgi:hypothetical protein
MKNDVHVTYYAEHTNDPKTWASPRPDFDLAKFNAELEKRAGSIGSVPRFRVRWAGEHDEYILEDYDEIVGYAIFHNGVESYLSAKDGEAEIPEGALVTPRYENFKVFTPRFVIEEYREPFYHKAWFVENVEKIAEQNGRFDILSRFRRPAEIDLQMAEQLAYLRRNLTDAEIAAGISKMQAEEVALKAEQRAEFVDEMAEETAKALTDGIPGAKEFNWKKTFSPNYIQDYSRALIQEHDRKI